MGSQMGAQVGTSALSMAGGYIGGMVGGPFGSMIGSLAGGIIGSLIFGRAKAKPLVPDVQIMNSSYGKPIPIVWGTMRLPVNMIWQGPISTHEHTVGKAFGTIAYNYNQSVALAVCEGPVTFKKLYLDGKLFMDWTALFPEDQCKYRFTIRTYPGDEAQLPDPKMVKWVQENVIPGASCPAYRGLAYMLYDDADMSHFGNRMPQSTVIVSTTAESYTAWKILARHTTKWWSNYRTAVDWDRGMVFCLYYPRSVYDNLFSYVNWGVITYSIYTMSEVLSADYDRIFFEGGLLPTALGPQFEADWIAGGPSGMVYVAGHNGVHSALITIQPGPMTFSGAYTLMVPRTAPDRYYTCNGIAVYGQGNSTAGVSDMIVGVLSGPGVFLIDPLGMLISNPYPVEYPNGYHEFQLGNDDQISGTRQLWILNGYGGSVDPLYRVLLYTDIIAGQDPSVQGSSGNFKLTGTINLADWGEPLITSVSMSWRTFYYATDDSIIIDAGGQNYIKWSSLTGVGWTGRGAGLGWTNRYADTTLGYIPLTGGGLFQIFFDGDHLFIDIDMATGRVTESPVRTEEAYNNIHWANSAAGVNSNSYGNYVAYVASNVGGFAAAGAGELVVAYMFRVDDRNAVPVATIIRDICHRVGMTDEMLDLNLVTQTTRGYCIQELKSAGAAIADLCHVYQIDMIESDYTLKFIPRGQPSMVTIPQRDLVSLDENDPSQFWRVKEAQQQELPMILSLRFQDVDLDFQTGATYAKRTEAPVPTVWSKRRMTIDLPIITNNLEATQIATKWLWTMWAERDTVQTVLPWKYLWLDPADNVTVNMDSGDIYEVRIEEQHIGADLSIHINAAFEDNTTYELPSTIKGATYGSLPQTVAQAPFADFLQFNVPLLQDSDDTGGVSTRIYYAVGSTAGSWITGEIFRSTDNSATWNDYINIPFSVNWATTLDALGDTAAKFSTDYLNTVTIILNGSSTFPLSCTYDQMLQGTNAALLGAEIIQYQTVTLNNDGSYTLSELLRGRRGTEWATNTHTAGERFIMLQAGKIGGNTLSLAEINVQELWKLVPSGRFLDQAPISAFTYRGFDLMPYAPVWMRRGAVDGTGLNIYWTRRTRMGSPLIDGTDTAPLFEAAELYNAYILPGPGAILVFNPANPLSYTRSYMGLTAATFVYTSGQMTTDSFYQATSTLYLAVYQVSSVVGMGFQGYAELPAY